jgi:ABC-type polysaccharide/polyol phosphate transport system ATPase subunit
MPNAVIHSEGLTKTYRRGLATDPGLRHALEKFVRAPVQAFRRPKDETFWALKDISLDVHEGEVLGLIGRNGAGKTTLLKILSRITRPTSGWAEIRGRVGSLLEVGTGFHPELSGRENTFLSGAILGMSKSEIRKKFKEIVAFAELAQFIDTPVKHYSSGMYVRLAFAVAAHLEPEILLVDEVLAVGDINFQKKCLGKMGDVARAGRTVVLVSHQLNQIRRLCQRVIWIDSGQVRQNGPTHEVVSAYESAMARGDLASTQQRRGPGTKARFLKWEIVEPSTEDLHTLDSFGPVTVQITVETNEAIRKGVHGIALYNQDRQVMWGWAAYNLELPVGLQELRYTFPSLPIRPGAYAWLVSLAEDDKLIDVWECVPDMVVAVDPVTHPRDEWSGLLNIPIQFAIAQKVPAGSNAATMGSKTQ